MRLNMTKYLKPLEMYSEIKQIRAGLDNERPIEEEFFQLLKIMSESQCQKLI